jgi:copper transport protein
MALLAGGAAFAQGPRPWASKVPPDMRSKSNPLPTSPDTITAGQAVYTNTCFPCHGQLAQGDGPASAYIKPSPKPLIVNGGLSLPDGVMFWVVSNGIDDSPMASFKDTLSETDRWAAITYLHSLAGGGTTAASTPKPAISTTSGAPAPSGSPAKPK